jgi:hypothetical protein
MGDLVNTTLVKRTGWAIVVVVVALNLWLLVGTALGSKRKRSRKAPFVSGGDRDHDLCRDPSRRDGRHDRSSLHGSRAHRRCLYTSRDGAVIMFPPAVSRHS